MQGAFKMISFESERELYDTDSDLNTDIDSDEEKSHILVTRRDITRSCIEKGTTKTIPKTIHKYIPKRDSYYVKDITDKPIEIKSQKIPMQARADFHRKRNLKEISSYQLINWKIERKHGLIYETNKECKMYGKTLNIVDSLRYLGIDCYDRAKFGIISTNLTQIRFSKSLAYRWYLFKKQNYYINHAPMLDQVLLLKSFFLPFLEQYLTFLAANDEKDDDRENLFWDIGVFFFNTFCPSFCQI